jgi:hypothetical protein
LLAEKLRDLPHGALLTYAFTVLSVLLSYKVVFYKTGRKTAARQQGAARSGLGIRPYQEGVKNSPAPGPEARQGMRRGLEATLRPCPQPSELHRESAEWMLE